MPATVVTVNASGGRPAVEIIIGNQQPATYDFHLFDATGANPQPFGTGRTGDGIPDIFPLPGGSVKDLDQTTIFWRAVVSSFTGQAGETFAVTVRVIQDGHVMGSDSKTGLVTDIPPEGFIRLLVS